MSSLQDQGLIPAKRVHFEKAVNITLGLPPVCTSLDRGTASDPAGTGEGPPGESGRGHSTGGSARTRRVGLGTTGSRAG